MLTLSEHECIKLIKQKKCFHASVCDGAFTIKIDEYSPVICAAIHDGHQLRKDLENNFLLSKKERFYEEDPYTSDLISSFPIQLIGNDSRFEYDLNRALTLSTYFKTAWNKAVWSKPLSSKQRNVSHQKHRAFYNILEAIVKVVEDSFKSAIVFDIHSYNYKRIEKDTPTFNIGSAQIDIERWKHIVKRTEKNLNKITLPNVDVRAAIDEVFQGRGYLISHINAHFDNTLVLPIEVKKVFMDEITGDVYPLVLEGLKGAFKEALADTAAYFGRKHGKKPRVQSSDMLSSILSDEVLAIDKKLFDLCKSIETLNFINPTNIAAQRTKFLKNPNIAPAFKYKQLNINPFKFREQLYKLPVENIEDAHIQQLYKHVIDNLANKIDLLATIGSDDFLYNSLKYYGKPSKIDVANARFILHLNNDEENAQDNMLNAEQATEYFKEIAGNWQLKCKVELSNKLVAKAMVNNEKAQLLINKSATFDRKELHAFAHHELGIHMLTTLNAKQHDLKVFSLGLPGNTHTQEGIAIYSEYCSGSLTISRLKSIALRVLAVHYMLQHSDFVKTYHALIDEFCLAKDTAFTLTTRVYRGGGFTKDYLYLKGFRDILNLAKQGNIENLLIGKTGINELNIINELVERNMIGEPKPLFDLSYKPTPDPILNFIVESIK